MPVSAATIATARKLYDEAQAMLDRIVAEKWLTARGVAGLWPCARYEDDVVVDLTGREATVAARVDDVVVDRAVASVAGRVRRLGHLARAPQTGAIHQYFLQTVAFLAAGAVVWSVYSVMG